MSFKELQRVVEENTGYSESWTRVKLRELVLQDIVKTRKMGRKNLYSLKNPTARVIDVTDFMQTLLCALAQMVSGKG